MYWHPTYCLKALIIAKLGVYMISDCRPLRRSKSGSHCTPPHIDSVSQYQRCKTTSDVSDRQQLLSVLEWIKLDSAEVLRELSDKSEREKRDYLLTLMNFKTDDGALMTKHYPRQLGGERKSVKSISNAALGIAAVAFAIFLVGGVLSGRVHWIGLVLALLLLVAMVIYGRLRR